MTMITNIRHFLDEEGDVPDLPKEALDLVAYLTSIIEAATMEDECSPELDEVKCRQIVNAKRCPGDVDVILLPESTEIEWQCAVCGEDGVISGWEGTKWDKREYVRH